MYKVIISNGVFRFHLLAAAAEARKRGVLALFLTGGYPKSSLMKLLGGYFGRTRGLNRLIDRADRDLNDDDVVPIWSAEFLMQMGVRLGKVLEIRFVNEYFQALGLDRYGRAASRAISKSYADIYHYRAGYGGRSVSVAKKKGMLCLCDHSIVSPLVLSYMLNNAGRFPNAQIIREVKLSPVWKRVMADIEAADHILVNSHFVRETLIAHDTQRRNISVIYQGLDRKFVEGLPSYIKKKKSNLILFAGEISRRKGFDSVIKALDGIPENEWELLVAGGLNESSTVEHKEFLKRKNVRHVGFVSRDELACLMSSALIFLFPTLAEGSARVVFEALACGCYIVTTPNAGSIVESGIHGALIQPGNVAEIRNALVSALSNPAYCTAIGENNRTLIANGFMQSEYGDQLDDLYHNLIKDRKGGV